MNTLHDDLVAEMIRDGILDVDFYTDQAPDLCGSSELDLCKHYIEIGERHGLAPSGAFDPRFYLESNPDLSGLPSLIHHFMEFGRPEGRQGSLAAVLIGEGLDELAITEGLVPAPAVEPSDPGYLNAFAAALRLADSDPRYFSREFYRERYPDITLVEPIVHYLKFGRLEKRVTNVSLLAGIHINDDAVQEGLPYIIIGVHEASKTGAPIVGMDLARQMASSHNVIFVTLRDGPLMESAKALFPVVVVASQIYDNNEFFIDFLFKKYHVKKAIFSSGCCLPFMLALSSRDCRITCLVHEFLEYMIPFKELIFISDLIVFSSRELLKSWQYLLDSFNRDPATVMVLPQPASGMSSRKMSKAEARAAVTAATGLDLDGATLVLGAGQIQIRKGTDIFVQIGSQLKRDPGKFVTVWIGEQVSELDMAFGIWFHTQIERSRDGSGQAPVHFEPVGPLYPILMDAADVFLVTSRLDPLPNVALDAAARGLPVIAFAGATGLADIAETGAINLIEVEIAAVDEVIAAIKSATSGSPSQAGRVLAGSGMMTS